MLPTTDVGWCRPWLNERGDSIVSVLDGAEKQVCKPAKQLAILTKVEWMEIDRVTVQCFFEQAPSVVELKRLQQVLRVDGLSRTHIPYDRDAGQGCRSTTSVALPFTYIDGIHLDARHLAYCRSHNAPFDASFFQAAGRRVGEAVEATIQKYRAQDPGAKLLVGLELTVLQIGDSFTVAAIMVPVPHDFELPR